ITALLIFDNRTKTRNVLNIKRSNLIPLPRIKLLYPEITPLKIFSIKCATTPTAKNTKIWLANASSFSEKLFP
ncbi:MAG: hypothetical protein IKT33_00685, partial [Clostridia bacterium]|nr:hypothetical protein [Clostridia bacterium]